MPGRSVSSEAPIIIFIWNENMYKGKKIVVVMPAYNAERTLEQTYRDIPKGIVDEILVIDDHSHDKTVDVCRSLGLKVSGSQGSL